jgi:hypothetical protein
MCSLLRILIISFLVVVSAMSMFQISTAKWGVPSEVLSYKCDPPHTKHLQSKLQKLEDYWF